MSASAVHSLWTTAATAAEPISKIDAPKIEYGQLSPTLIVLGAAVVGVLVEAFVPRKSRYYAQVFVAVVALAAAFSAVVALAAGGYGTTKAHIAAMGAIAVDGPALFLQGTILLAGILGVFTFAERRLDPEVHGNRVDSFAAQAASVPGSDSEKAAVKAGFTTTEVFPLLLFAISGMLVFPAANDLLTLFVALEVFSLPLYLLCAVARRKRLMSQEAAVKYFLLGAFASAFTLFGIALLYGYAGSVSYATIAHVVDGTVTNVDPALAGTMGNDVLLLMGMALVVMGLLFKVGAVPFHMWTPDVYQGAPTPVTGFMAAATKVAAFGALLRLLYVVLPGMRWDWRPVMWAVAIVTMLGARSSRSPRPTSSGSWRTRRSRTPDSSSRVSSRPRRTVCRRSCSTWARTPSSRSAPSPSSRSYGTRAARRRTCPSGPVSDAGPHWWPRCSRSSCWPSRVSRSLRDSPESSPCSRRLPRAARARWSWSV